MKNNMRKLFFATFAISFAFVLGSAVQVKATETDITDASAKIVDGSATMSYLNKNVYKISLPTDDVLRNALTYQADPQNLVKDTSAAQFGDAEIGESDGIFFKHMSGTTVKSVSGKSDPFVITNKSSSGVTLGIDAKLVNANTNSYSGGFSTTKDFSGNSDKGVYLGLYATGELGERALSTTSTAFSGIAISAADKYEVGYNTTTEAYEYVLDSSATGFPTYEFTLEGALNHDIDEDAWVVKDSSGNPSARNMPTVQLKYTPALIKGAKGLNVVVEDEDFYLSKASAKSADDGGFGTTKPTALIVNGKNVTPADNADGYIHFTWDELCKAFSYTGKNDEKIDQDIADGVYNGNIAIEVTWGGSVYYGEKK